jgi:hypothetical protein
MENIKKILFLNPPDTTLVDNANNPGYAYFEPSIGLLCVYSYDWSYYVSKLGVDVDKEFLDIKEL